MVGTGYHNKEDNVPFLMYPDLQNEGNFNSIGLYLPTLPLVHKEPRETLSRSTAPSEIRRTVKDCMM